MHTRKVITRSGACVRGCFFSLKSGRLIQWQSQLERDALLVIDFDDRVASFRGYQEEIRIGKGEGAFRAYPDVYTRLVDGSVEIVEIKSDAALADTDVSRRLGRIATHFGEKGIGYRVLAEREIRLQPRLKNLETLATFRRPRAKECLAREADIREILELTHSTTFGYVSTRLGNTARALQLIANGFLNVDLDLPLRPDSRVCVAKGMRS